MYLRRVEVHGFKSFPRKTVVEFETGLTALVGPNGAGKSNIADAIRWALGEQSARTLRAQRTEDVIFGGTPKRSRSGMAEVTLVFDNGDGWLPLEYREVSVTRRAYRSGENDYILNGSSVRLRDLQDLLRTGAMGVNGQVVVGQGQIDAILRLKPEDRRMLIEEAAGVSRHYAKRDEARRRLQRTERNLERLRDLHVELVPRLEALALQAQVAERSRDLGEELKTQTRGLLRHRLAQAAALLESAKLAERAASEKLAALEAAGPQTAADSADAAVEAARVRLDESRAALERVRADLAETSASSRLARQRAGFEKRAIAELSARKLEISELIAALRAASEKDRFSLEESRSRARQLETELAGSGAEPVTADRLQQLQQNVIDARRESSRLASDIARLQESDQELSTREDEARKDAEQGRSSLADAEQTLRGQKKRVESARNDLEDAEASAARASDARAAAAKEVQTARSALETAAANVMRCKAEIAGRRAEADALSAVSATSKRDASAVSRLLANADSLHVKGLLRSGIEHVPDRLKVAVAAALGHLLDDVVVERASHLDAVLEFISDQQASGVRVRPARGFQSRKRRRLFGGGTPAGPGILGTLHGMVEVSPSFERALAPVLESVLVVDTLRTAIDLRSSRGDAADYHIVSLEGDLLDRDGSILTDAHNGTVSFDPGREAQAKQRLSEAEASLAGFIQSEAAARANLAEATKGEREAIGALETAAASVTQAKARSRGVGEEISLANRQMSWWKTVTDRAGNALEEIASRRQATRTRLLELHSSIEPARQAVGAADGALSKAHAAQLGGPAARLELERERISNSTESLSHREAEITARRQALERLKADLDGAGKREEEALAEADRLDERAAGLRLTRPSREDEMERLNAELRKLELERERAALEARSRDLELAQLRTSIDNAHHRSESARQRMSELRERATNELDEADLKPRKISGAVSDVVAEIERLRHLVEVIGPVNPLAPRQYLDEKRRVEDLGIQIDDMEKSTAQLRKMSDELERAVRGEFMEAFEKMRGSFQKYFESLVGGGDARMNLADPRHPATTGIEIDVRIPGKRRQSLNALSGGERALVSAALLFAMIDYRSGPICVLDEVDAALDEANIVRFQTVLHEFADRMQLILITHNAGSIERAASVFGVVMAADGISQVVSLRLNGVEQSSLRRESGAAVRN